MFYISNYRIASKPTRSILSEMIIAIIGHIYRTRRVNTPVGRFPIYITNGSFHVMLCIVHADGFVLINRVTNPLHCPLVCFKYSDTKKVPTKIVVLIFSANKLWVGAQGLPISVYPLEY